MNNSGLNQPFLLLLILKVAYIIRRQSTGLCFFLFCGDFLFSTDLSGLLQRFFLFGDFSVNIFTHFTFAEIFLI